MDGPFSGTSENGDFGEALARAIAQAKNDLGPTDYVRWTLAGVGGENGGFVLKNDLTVTIDASAAPADG